MQRSMAILLLCMSFSGFAEAAEEDEWAQALEIPCHPLVTQAECRAHRDQLALLPEGAAREAYLTHYLILVEERVNSCGCSRAQNTVGVLHVR